MYINNYHNYQILNSYFIYIIKVKEQHFFKIKLYFIELLRALHGWLISVNYIFRVSFFFFLNEQSICLFGREEIKNDFSLIKHSNERQCDKSPESWYFLGKIISKLIYIICYFVLWTINKPMNYIMKNVFFFLSRIDYQAEDKLLLGALRRQSESQRMIHHK